MVNLFFKNFGPAVYEECFIWIWIQVMPMWKNNTRYIIKYQKIN